MFKIRLKFLKLKKNLKILFFITTTLTESYFQTKIQTVYNIFLTHESVSKSHKSFEFSKSAFLLVSNYKTAKPEKLCFLSKLENYNARRQKLQHYFTLISYFCSDSLIFITKQFENLSAVPFLQIYVMGQGYCLQYYSFK